MLKVLYILVLLRFVWSFEGLKKICIFHFSNFFDHVGMSALGQEQRGKILIFNVCFLHSVENSILGYESFASHVSDPTEPRYDAYGYKLSPRAISEYRERAIVNVQSNAGKHTVYYNNYYYRQQRQQYYFYTYNQCHCSTGSYCVLNGYTQRRLEEGDETSEEGEEEFEILMSEAEIKELALLPDKIDVPMKLESFETQYYQCYQCSGGYTCDGLHQYLCNPGLIYVTFIVVSNKCLR